jgi:phosphodiesterase/alkaline phosphatase D-like protein
MKGFILTFSSFATIAGLSWLLADDRVMAAAPTHNAAQITADPELETATDTFAIIRWTIPNPGGTALHFGIVHYGTDAKNLSEVAKSPNRRDPSHPDMTFRVRVMGLNSNTTYYYTVESAGATDRSDGVSSPVKTFKTK